MYSTAAVPTKQRGQTVHGRQQSVQQVLRLGLNPAWQEVLKVLADEIQAWKERPEFATKLLQDVGKKRPLLAEVILRCMRKASIEVNVLHSNVVAGAYVRGRKWLHALDVTRQLTQHHTEPDIISVSTNVRACMERSRWSLALSDLKKMQSMKAGISRYTKAVLAPLKSANAWDAALWFHFWLTDFRLDPDHVSTSEVLGSCKAGGHWQDAVALHREISFPPRHLHLNTFLDVLCYGGQWCRSYAWLLQMPEMRVLPDLVTANTAINAAPWRLSLIAFSEFLERHSIQLDVVSYASIMSEESAWQEASLCLQEMRQEYIFGNIRIWNSCIRSKATSARWFEVLDSMIDMTSQSLEPDGITYTLALSAVKQSQFWCQAVVMTSRLESSAVSLDQVAWSSVSRAHALSNLWQTSMSVLRRHGNQIRLDVVMQNEILDAYEKSADWRSTLQACCNMYLSGLQQDAVSFCAVMSGCHSSDSWRWMTGILEDLLKASQADQTCLNSAISAYSQTDQWRSSLSLLGQMPMRSISADEISFNAAIQACTGQPHWERMCVLVSALQVQRLKMDLCRESVLQEIEQRGLSGAEVNVLETMMFGLQELPR